MQADAPLRQKVNLESRVVNPGTFHLQFYEGKGRIVVPGNHYLPFHINIQRRAEKEVFPPAWQNQGVG